MPNLRTLACTLSHNTRPGEALQFLKEAEQRGVECVDPGAAACLQAHLAHIDLACEPISDTAKEWRARLKEAEWEFVLREVEKEKERRRARKAKPESESQSH